MRIGELFAGYGGLGMGVKAALGGEVAWVSDIDNGACKILAHRFPGVPNLGDITTVDWSRVEPVDVLTGGFPCQDVSSAGKRAGLKPGTRSGLWSHFAYAIDQLRPSLVVIENVRGLLSARAHSDVEPCPWCVGDDPDGALRALGAVLGDLADIGYDAAWYGLSASGVGACHGRFRVFVVAFDPDGEGREWPWWSEQVGRIEPARKGGSPADTRGEYRHQWRISAPRETEVGRPLGEFAGRDRAHVTPLLPTPAVNDMGAAYTPDEWDAWTGRMKAAHGNGNGHGKSLNELVTGQSSWGDYAAAIATWADILGRPAPNPTEPGPKGNPRLSPAFTEWMMGLPAGWITDVPGITRNEALKACGNGVVPQQAEAAVRWLLTVRQAVAS